MAVLGVIDKESRITQVQLIRFVTLYTGLYVIGVLRKFSWGFHSVMYGVICVGCVLVVTS